MRLIFDIEMDYIYNRALLSCRFGSWLSTVLFIRTYVKYRLNVPLFPQLAVRFSLDNQTMINS